MGMTSRFGVVRRTGVSGFFGKGGGRVREVVAR